MASLTNLVIKCRSLIDSIKGNDGEVEESVMADFFSVEEDLNKKVDGVAYVINDIEESISALEGVLEYREKRVKELKAKIKSRQRSRDSLIYNLSFYLKAIEGYVPKKGDKKSWITSSGLEFKYGFPAKKYEVKDSVYIGPDGKWIGVGEDYLIAQADKFDKRKAIAEFKLGNEAALKLLNEINPEPVLKVK